MRKMILLPLVAFVLAGCRDDPLPTGPAQASDGVPLPQFNAGGGDGCTTLTFFADGPWGDYMAPVSFFDPIRLDREGAIDPGELYVGVPTETRDGVSIPGGPLGIYGCDSSDCSWASVPLSFERDDNQPFDLSYFTLNWSHATDRLEAYRFNAGTSSYDLVGTWAFPTNLFSGAGVVCDALSSTCTFPGFTGVDYVLWYTSSTGDAFSAIDDVAIDCPIPVNHPPEADADGPYMADEGSAIVFNGAGSNDPDGDPLTYAWSFGDTYTGSGETPSHTFADDGEYTVSLVVADAYGAFATDNTTATISNVPPTCGPVTGLPIGPVAAGTPATASGSFTDPGTQDTHTAVWDWDDGTSSAGTVTAYSVGPNGHTYGGAGVYEISLTVTDDDGGVCFTSYQYLVVYDQSGGFATGAGWIDSPSGAYTPDNSADPDYVGKAFFAFVSKYQKGKTFPDGNATFRFKAAGLDLESTSYDWLVVNQGGTNAQFKGAGTINDATGPTGSDYRFMIWAGDDNPDTFRIRIWYQDSGEQVVYDNGVAQGIGGGAIKIHQ